MTDRQTENEPDMFSRALIGHLCPSELDDELRDDREYEFKELIDFMDFIL